MTNSLIIFTRNEIEGIRAIFPRIPLGVFDEVITMDGHSTDGTVEFLEKNGIRVIEQEKLGRGNATIEGVQHTTGDNVVLLSADGSETPRAFLNSNRRTRRPRRDLRRWDTDQV